MQQLVDCVEIGMTPPEGCENWIAPFAQNAFAGFKRTRIVT